MNQFWASKSYGLQKLKKKLQVKFIEKFQFFQNRVLKMFRMVKKYARHFHHNLSAIPILVTPLPTYF